MLAIRGAKGVGKSTILRQYIRSHYQANDRSVLYCSLDNNYFADHSILDLAEGNTYAMQRISHELFDEMAVNETADRQILTKAVNNIIEAEAPRYARLLSHVPERQQSLLFAIAKEGRVQKIMSGAFLRKYHLSSSSAVQNAIKHLMEMDLVTQDDNKQFVVEDIFLRMYLNRISEK